MTERKVSSEGVSALPPVDGLEVVMEKICHKEQIGIWANEITSALALSYFLREEWTFDDSVDLEKEIAAQIRYIIKSAITHPGLDLVASLSQASSVIAGLREANEALMRERTSLIETKREQIERLTKERASLEEEIKRLREALKPFADAADVFATEYPAMLDKPATSCGIRFDALQSARQALGDHNG